MMELLAQSPFDATTERGSSFADWLPPDFGAVGQYMHLRAQALAERGHDVTLVGPRPAPVQSFVKLRDGNADGTAAIGAAGAA